MWDDVRNLYNPSYIYRSPISSEQCPIVKRVSNCSKLTLLKLAILGAMDLATELPTSSIVESANADEPFNLGQDGDLVIPERLFSDWLEMIMLAVILLLGVPLNVMTLSRLLNSLRKGKSSDKTKVNNLLFLRKIYEIVC